MPSSQVGVLPADAHPSHVRIIVLDNFVLRATGTAIRAALRGLLRFLLADAHTRQSSHFRNELG